MERKLRIAIVQHAVEAGCVDRNLARVESLLDGSERVDLMVLSEMFATGFDVADAALAEPSGGRIFQWMCRLARERHTAVAGSVAVAAADGLRNRHYLIYPDGGCRCYDKRHLFGFGGETRLYRPGGERVVAEVGGARVLLQTCYDLRFPVFSRNCGDYDVAVYVASWPQSRISAWDVLLPARAVENAAYVVGVNRVGDAPGLHYNGHSRVFDYLGREIARVADNVEGVAVAELDIDRLRSFRHKFPVLSDADSFHLK